MPSIEKHVEHCVRVFGKDNEDLCYQVNRWMDGKLGGKLGPGHRALGYDLDKTVLTAVHEFLTEDAFEALFSKSEETESSEKRTIKIASFKTLTTTDGKIRCEDKEEYKQKAGLIASIVIQHLIFDGLLTQREFSRLQKERIELDVQKARARSC